ncbi:MAG TPA: ATP-binding protein [Terracidiphilus sp.]|nr:ATP-binding protein [Terracidiphilus sp.]
MIETLEVIPDPVSLIEAMRAVGYTAEAAVADIIDNSLSAGATEVQVKYDAADVPFVAILDDGHGMSPDELTNAMRHGSGNPADRRDATDLGRFGLGLKTASLSQCRKLTVVSRKGGAISARRWDLDVVQDERKWLVVVPSKSELADLPMYGMLESQSSGTLVVWQELDRLTAGASDTRREMTAKMAPLFEHLALVFHRFTQCEGSHPSTTITVNSLPLPRRDPFLGSNQFRQELEGQAIQHERGEVSVLPYVLPPVSKLSAHEVETAGGREGLRGTQGFYVYRGRRLVIWGTWFGLVPKEEFFKLTRVRVDIPNTFDDLWALDIKKSAAHPPDSIRSRLRELIPHFANASKRTVTYNGRVINDKKFVPLWIQVELERGTFRYEANPEHPLIKKLSQSIGDTEQRHLQMILELLGSAIPYQGIYAVMCADQPRANQGELLKELVEMAENMLEVTGLGIDQILEIDPLCRHPDLHEKVREKVSN